MTGKITALFIKPGHKKKMEAQDYLLAVKWRGGISGDISLGRSKRQVLLVEQEMLDEFDINPGQLRENIVTSGVTLTGLAVGSLIQIGRFAVLLEVTGDCAPCKLVEDIRPGLEKAIAGRRGILCLVKKSGIMRLDDTVTLA